MTKQGIDSKIVGTGRYLPYAFSVTINSATLPFFDHSTPQAVLKKVTTKLSWNKEITNISERRWITDELNNSDMATLAIQDACASANIDPETLDFILIGHNFGDVDPVSTRVDILPGLANRVKAKLGIQNPACFCHDIISGCPGWTQGMITADAYIRSGMAKRGVVVGSDVLSRISDPHDRDTMIYADGAGATIVEAVESEEPTGILSHSSRSDSVQHWNLLISGRSFNPDFEGNDLFIKMHGHKLYVYAISYVPGVVKDSLERPDCS